MVSAEKDTTTKSNILYCIYSKRIYATTTHILIVLKIDMMSTYVFVYTLCFNEGHLRISSLLLERF